MNSLIGSIPKHQYIWAIVYLGIFSFTNLTWALEYSNTQKHSKELQFIKLNNGRISIQPINKILIEDKGFTVNQKIDLTLQKKLLNMRLNPETVYNNIIMDIFLKAYSSNFGADTGDLFSLSANLGNVIPNQITKNELISGKILTVDDLASTIIVSSANGTCTNTLSITIDKDNSTCHSVNALSFQPGNNRPINADGTIAPFNTAILQANQLNNFSTAQDGTQFSLNIPGQIITFSIEATTNNEDGSYLKIGTATGNSFGNGQFNALFLSTQEVDIDVLFFDASVGYTIKGNLNSNLTVEQWSIHDLVSSGY